MPFKTKATYITPIDGQNEKSSSFRFQNIEDSDNFEKLCHKENFFCKPDRLLVKNIFNVSEQNIIIFYKLSKTQRRYVIISKKLL